ncbi:hypothetical protein ACHAWO_013039 [Cyclotella atomus]|uniref:HMG box domain-containing protein n=1 Tax=Cyclotella atomus TaxID=382360 RepID=A0ABD3QFI6_9STRA
MDANHNTNGTSSHNDSSLQAKLNEIKRTDKGAKHKDGRPLRPLSACNIFFQMERNRITKEQANPDAKHASGAFANLTNTILARWKNIDGALKIELDAKAKLDKERYNREVDVWKANMLRIAEEAASKAAASSADVAEEAPARDGNLDSVALSESTLDSIANSKDGRRSITVKPGAVIPPLPFKVTRGRGRGSSNNVVGVRPLVANHETGLPLVTPVQSRPSLQQAFQAHAKKH